MRRIWSSSGRRTAILIAMLGTIAAIVLSPARIVGKSPSAPLNREAGPRLISIEPLSQPEGEMCEWAPAAANLPLTMAALEREQSSISSGDAIASDATRLAASQRKPIRIIRDPYSTYSSIAVDPVHNEVVMTDESLFNIMVYDRETNTPPTASLSEPKRMIGGLNTKVEFQCGLYIDPANGDIYAVNNDTVNTLVIFSRQAKGNVAPDRELYTPHGTFGVAVDETAQDLYLTVQHDNAVVVFKKGARNDDSPVRLLQGNRTALADPHGITLDLKNRLIFVTNHGSSHLNRPSGKTGAPGAGAGRSEGKTNWPVQDAIPGSGKNFSASITVYPLDAKGDTPPLRVIQGARTQMNWPSGIAYDARRNELYVANDMGHSILVFSATANGDAAPVRVLTGPKTLIKYPTGLYLDAQHDELWVANFGNHTATVYKTTAEGDTPPLRVIRAAPSGKEALNIGNPGALAYDSRREEILAPN